MTLSLPSQLYSTRQLDGLVLEMSQYADFLRSAAITQIVANGAAPTEEPSWSAIVPLVIRAAGITDPMSAEDLDNLVLVLKDLQQTAPSCNLTLAAVPNQLHMQRIVTWFRQNIDPNMLISFEVNRAVLGGVVVRAGSHIYDYSWRKQLLAKKDLIPEIINRVRG